MRDIKSLSLSEIKNLLKEYFGIEIIGNMRLILKTNVNFDYKEYISGIVAKNIKNKNYDENIFSARRIRYMLDIAIKKHVSLVKEYQEAKDDEKKYIRRYINNVIKIFYKNVRMDYDDCLSFIKTVLVLVDEKNISIKGLFLEDGIRDEIVRRMYTKEQLITRCALIMNKYTNYAFLKSIIIDSEIEAFQNLKSEGDGHYVENKKHYRESKAKIRHDVKTMRRVIKEYVANNVYRIYKP